MALQITGQLTGNDGVPYKDTVNYARLYAEPKDDNTLSVLVRIFRNKLSFTSGGNHIGLVNEVDKRYKIDAILFASLPVNNAGINAMPGKSVYDKFHYWVNEQIAAMIIADNPTFTILIKDVNI